MVVAKANRWQGRHGIIDTNDCDLRVAFLIKFKIGNVILTNLTLGSNFIFNLIKICWFIIICDIAFDVPKLAQKVAQGENGSYEFYHFEKELDIEQQLNLIQIQICVFSNPGVVSYSLLHFAFEVSIEKSHYFLDVENLETSINSDDFNHLKVLFKVTIQIYHVG